MLFVHRLTNPQEIRPGDYQHRPLRCVGLHLHQADAGEPHGIGPEGGAGGEDAHALISPQPGRPHRGGPALVGGEIPDQPEVGEALQPPEHVRIPIRRFKHHPGPKLRHQARLPGNPKLPGKITPNSGNHIHCHLHLVPLPV